MYYLEFTSAKFLPLLPEECQANPGAYGFELAWWLAQTLARSGLVTRYPLGEDWGWFIEYIEGEAEFMIGCSSQCDEGEGYRGDPVAWAIFIKQRRSIKQRLKRQPDSAAVSKLTDAIASALGAEGIEAVVSESG